MEGYEALEVERTSGDDLAFVMTSLHHTSVARAGLPDPREWCLTERNDPRMSKSVGPHVLILYILTRWREGNDWELPLLGIPTSWVEYIITVVSSIEISSSVSRDLRSSLLSRSP